MTVSPAETLSVPLFSTRESGAVATSPPRARCVPDRPVNDGNLRPLADSLTRRLTCEQAG